MLHPLLHRGSSLCTLCGRASGNRLFVKWFSSTTVCWAASAKKEWTDIFEGIFDRSIEKQSSRSTPLLLSIFKDALYSKGARDEASNGVFTGKKLQLSEDDKLLQVFRHLIKELNVDRAIVLCAQLPANHLETGIDRLIRVCLEGVYEVTYQQELADKIFKLLKKLNGKGFTPSKATSQNLLKWLLGNGEVLRAQSFQQLLQNQRHSKVTKAFGCPERMDLVQVEHFEDTMSRDPVKESDSVAGSSVPGLITVFHSLGRLGYQEKSLDTFMHLQLKGMPKDSMSKLLDFYARGLTEVFCRNSRDIKRDVEGFKKINKLLRLSTSTSFNMLISHCANHGEIDLCIDLIQTMKSNGLQPCAASYEPLIAFFAGTLEISKAEDILQMMKMNGMHASTRAYESLILAHTKSHNLEKAFNLIEDIPWEELTANVYTPIIHAYGLMGQVSLALSVFTQMKLKNVNPSAQNFTSLIRACAIRKDLKSAEKVYKLFKKQGDIPEEYHKWIMVAMLRVYATCGNDWQIEKIMSCTHSNDLVRPEAKSALLKGLADRGKTQTAIQIYNQIRNGGEWPESRAFLSLLASVGEAGELDQLLALFDPFKKSLQKTSRVYQEHLLSLACCTTVHALIHHKQLERALDFLQKIQQENAGDVETLCLKVFTREKCNTVSGQHEGLTLKDKLEFLCAMRDRLNVQPTRLAYECLLESCAKEKNADCAEHVLHMMKTDNLVFNVFTYLILLRIVVSCGDLNSLNLFLSKMGRAVENLGLQDKHVKLVVIKILERANIKTSDLNCESYPSSDTIL